MIVLVKFSERFKKVIDNMTKNYNNFLEVQTKLWRLFLIDSHSKESNRSL